MLTVESLVSNSVGVENKRSLSTYQHTLLNIVIVNVFLFCNVLCGRFCNQEIAF